MVKIIVSYFAAGGCVFVGIFSLALGIYKLVVRKEPVNFRSFVHFPLHSADILSISAAHNIIDGIGFIIVGLVTYAVVFHWDDVISLFS